MLKLYSYLYLLYNKKTHCRIVCLIVGGRSNYFLTPIFVISPCLNLAHQARAIPGNDEITGVNLLMISDEHESDRANDPIIEPTIAITKPVIIFDILFFI